jgi:hypothetical protein
MNKRFAVLFTICLAVAFIGLSPSAASAQCLCSGRCYLDIYGNAYCGFGIFSNHECLEFIDYCAEFACSEPGCLKTQEPESAAARDLFPTFQTQQCRIIRSAFLPDGGKEVLVVHLKART